MPNIKLVVEYDGAAFCGWQSQTDQRSIEDELKRALSTVLRQEIKAVYASGRTDAGVHARGQVVNFHCAGEPDLFRMNIAVGSLLRGELAILHSEFVPDDFHARKSAKAKCYSYLILNRDAPAVLERHRAWYVAGKLNKEVMFAAAGEFIGAHDFSSFRASGCQAKSAHKQIFDCKLEALQDGLLRFEIIGSGFLKQMVRNIVGTLVDLGRDALEIKSVREMIDLRDRRRCGMTAPAHALVLEWVSYEELAQWS